MVASSITLQPLYIITNISFSKVSNVPIEHLDVTILVYITVIAHFSVILNYWISFHDIFQTTILFIMPLNCGFIQVRQRQVFQYEVNFYGLQASNIQ